MNQVFCGEVISGEKKVVVIELSIVEKPSSKTKVNLLREGSRLSSMVESNSKPILRSQLSEITFI
jgi:hypothetical protein